MRSVSSLGVCAPPRTRPACTGLTWPSRRRGVGLAEPTPRRCSPPAMRKGSQQLGGCVKSGPGPFLLASLCTFLWFQVKIPWLLCLTTRYAGGACLHLTGVHVRGCECRWLDPACCRQSSSLLGGEALAVSGCLVMCVFPVFPL